MEDLTTGRVYEVIAVTERRNAPRKEMVMCPGPFTHTEAVRVVAAHYPRPRGACKDTRIQVREIVEPPATGNGCCDHCGRRLAICMGDERCGPTWKDGRQAY